MQNRDPNKIEDITESVVKGGKGTTGTADANEITTQEPALARGEGVRNFGQFRWNVSGHSG